MNKRTAIMALLLALVTALLAVGHLNTRAGAEPGMLLVVAGDERIEVDIGALPFESVKGTVVNGKGEAREIDAEGVALSDVLAAAEVTVSEEIRVVASDEYAATVSAEELEEPGTVWLIKEEDTLRMIVFGDENSRRNVRNVERIEVN